MIRHCKSVAGWWKVRMLDVRCGWGLRVRMGVGGGWGGGCVVRFDQIL